MRLLFTLTLIALAFASTGCTRGYKTVLGGETYAPVPMQHVAILVEFPDQSYKVIGLVHSHGAALASDDAVYRKFQKSAADMGADAVVVGNAAMNYRGTINEGSVSGNVYGDGYVNGHYSGVSVPLYGLDVTGVAIRYTHSKKDSDDDAASP